MGLATDVRKLKASIIKLPYESRVEADKLVHKWEAVRRLSQMEQLRLDQLLELTKH